MASTIIGVGRKLSWDDLPEAEPPAQAPHADAGVFMRREVSGFSPQVVDPKAASPVYAIADSISVRIALDAGTFRAPSLKKLSAAARTALLRHEQGHYDIYALMTRDHFYELTAMTRRTFANQAEITAHLASLKKTYLDPVRGIQEAYDTDTGHSLDGKEQKVWRKAIASAAQTRRRPAATGVNGKPLEITLIDALKAADLLV